MSTEHDRDEVVDDALRAYLAAELDPQLGRARRAFERHVAMSTTQTQTPTRRVRSGGWVIGVVGTALAASVAAAWALPGLWSADPPKLTHVESVTAPTPQDLVAQPTPAPSTSAGWKQGDFGVTSVSRDVACVVIDDAPARVVERVDVERRQWFDTERNVRIEAVSPRHDVRLIGVDTY